MEKIVSGITLLDIWLMNDPDAEKWADAMASGRPKDNDELVEKTRSYLTNEFVRPRVKANKIDDTVRRAALVTAIFNRANATRVMKLRREDPECPRGMLWITDADLAAMGINAPTEQRATISSAYVELLETGDDDFKSAMREALKCREPKWYMPTGAYKNPTLGCTNQPYERIERLKVDNPALGCGYPSERVEE